MVELVVRLVFSLAVVVGMLLLLARFSAKRFRGSASAPIRVVHRQALSRSSSVAVVTIGSRVLVLGTTEQQVQLLTELDPEELEVMDPALESELDEPAVQPVAVQPVAVQPVHDPVLEPVAFQPATFRPAPVAAPVATRVAAPVATRVAPTVAADRPKRGPKSHKPARAPRPTTGDGPLAGSLLSAQTWKQALAAATGRGMDLT